MKLTRFGLLLASVTVVGASLVVACGDDDDGGGTTPAPANDAGNVTTPDASAPDSSTPDGGTADAGDGGSTTPKALGQTCAGNAECESNVCFVGGSGGGGNASGNFCTLTCAPTNTENVATCTAHADVFSGKCNGRGFCQKK